jgi:hypothetical protein
MQDKLYELRNVDLVTVEGLTRDAFRIETSGAATLCVITTGS